MMCPHRGQKCGGIGSPFFNRRATLSTISRSVARTCCRLCNILPISLMMPTEPRHDSRITTTTKSVRQA